MKATDDHDEDEPAKIHYSRASRWGDGEAKATLSKSYVESMKNAPLFCILINTIGSKWVEGKADYKTNRIRLGNPDGVRFLKKDVDSNYDTALNYFKKDAKKIYDNRSSSKFLRGDESVVLTESGDPVKEFRAGMYKFTDLNYDLTKSLKATVINIVQDDAVGDYYDLKKGVKVYCIKLADFLVLKEKIQLEKLKVIATHMSKVIGADVKYDKDDDKFKIPWFRIMNGEAHGDKRSVIEKGYSAEPFFTREQAEKQIENLKKQTSDEKFPFNPNELEIEECDEYDQFELSLAQLIEYIEEFGIKFNLPEFLEQKKGAIAAKKFGF